MSIKLIAEAKLAINMAHAPYSGFCVGTAVLGDDGAIYHGANIEVNCSSAGICAERVALAKCITAGAKPIHIAIVADTIKCISPCGSCRQFMIEFAPLKVTMANFNGEVHATTINELLPAEYDRKVKR